MCPPSSPCEPSRERCLPLALQTSASEIVPTVGFSVERFSKGGMTFEAFDMSGVVSPRRRSPLIWQRHYVCYVWWGACAGRAGTVPVAVGTVLQGRGGHHLCGGQLRQDSRVCCQGVTVASMLPCCVFGVHAVCVCRQGVAIASMLPCCVFSVHALCVCVAKVRQSLACCLESLACCLAVYLVCTLCVCVCVCVCVAKVCKSLACCLAVCLVCTLCVCVCVCVCVG